MKKIDLFNGKIDQNKQKQNIKTKIKTDQNQQQYNVSTEMFWRYLHPLLTKNRHTYKTKNPYLQKENKET